MILLYILLSIAVLMFVFVFTIIVGLTVQGKMAGGMSRPTAYKELLKELLGGKW